MPFRELLKKISPTWTAAVVGIGDTAVAVAAKLTGDPERVPDVAVIVIAPTVAPAVTVTLDTPEASVGTLAADVVAGAHAHSRQHAREQR